MSNITTIYNRWLKKKPTLKQKEYTIVLAEGLGNYDGKQNTYAKNRNLHNLGRMGAELGIFHNGRLIFSSKNASTLPDIPMDNLGRFNDKTPTPTACIGVYPLYTKMHGRKKKYPAFELGKYNQTIPVIRNNKSYIEYKSTSCAINLHYRTKNDSMLFGWSTGCQTMLKEDFDKVIKVLGRWKSGKYVEGQYVADIIIDRSQVTETLQTRYKSLYGKYFKECFNLDDNNINVYMPNTSKPIEKDTIIPDWWKNGLNGLVEDGNIGSPNYWKERINKPLSGGEIYALLDKSNKLKK
jgi:hypothetical protein